MTSYQVCISVFSQPFTPLEEAAKSPLRYTAQMAHAKVQGLER